MGLLPQQYLPECGALLVVVRHPGLEIGLQLVEVVVQLLLERQPVELSSSCTVLWKRSYMTFDCGCLTRVLV